MPWLRKSDYFAECDICHVGFDPVYGGACESCRRLLCGRHLFGSFTRRLLGYLGARHICVECRAGGGRSVRSE